MPQDRLHIAIEHHRSGRLREAGAAYRQIVREEPANAEAHLWLGMLMYQAGRSDQALPLLERASTLRPQDASVWHNLAQAYLALGRAGDAVEALKRALGTGSGEPTTLHLLGVAYLARKGQADAAAAAQALAQAHAAGLDTAELHYHRAVALLGMGDLEGTIAACGEAVSKNPSLAGAFYIQAMAHRARGDTKEQRKSLLKALEIDPKLAPAWCALGSLDVEAGNPAIAESLFRRAIKADPKHVPAHEGLGQLLEALGREGEAAEAFIAAARSAGGTDIPPATTASPADALAQLEERMNDAQVKELHYALAGQYELFPPPQVPSAILARFYNRYSETFEKHLRTTLNYQVPELILEALKQMHPARPYDMLDLGCGTGVCGELLKPLCASVSGVDLSPGMVDKARARGVYDQLQVGDLVTVLQKSHRSYDLLVSADVLIYTGDLNAVFEAAAQALRPGGLFIFSVEAGTAARYEFSRKTRRFTHSRPYLHHLAEIHGFVEERFDEIVVRTEAREPVAGFLLILRWPGE